MKTLKRLFVLGIAVFCSTHSHAGLQIPYTPNADTLHLWHFDDPTAYVGGLNTETDAVVTGGITLTNIGLGGPPYTNIFLVTNDVAPGLLDSLSILPGDGASGPGDSHAMAAGPSDLPASSFINSSSGAFTFEALVNPRGNIFSSSAGSGEWEIFCGDNSVGSRGWQFRLQNGPTPQINCNFISQSGGSAFPNVVTGLPLTGLDALATNTWYHVAVTYTGNTPTNNDTPGVLTFYWTLLDPNRTNADYLASFTNSAWGTLGGTPSPAVGGSQRTTHGVGNQGAFQGFIDEVRVTDLALTPDAMVFTTNAVINPPTFQGGVEPTAGTFLGYGQPLSVNALALGTQPIFYQWQKTNSASGGWTNVVGQTNNTYAIGSVTFADAGFYQVIATNAALHNNSATSLVAQVTVGANVSELFNTGYNTNGVLDTTLAGLADPHYTIVQSADINNLGPSALVWNMSANPIAAYNGSFANPDGVSQWIGTQANDYSSPAGQYTYRTYFLLDSIDTTQPLTLSGTWWENNVGTAILLNGQPTGNTGVQDNAQKSNRFVITNGFKPGLNALDFVVTQDGSQYQESAVRVEISGIGQPLPPGLPTITNQPVSQTVEDGAVVSGTVAQFSVVALGRPPLSYQWWADGNLVAGATNRTLVFDSPASTASPGTNFSVVVSNDSGSVTSSVAVLTLVSTDQPPVVANYNLVIYSNTTTTFNLDTAFAAATDSNGYVLTLGNPAYDTTSTNGGAISANGVVLTYTPVADYLGADRFNYYVSDGQGTISTGAVNLTVVPLLIPTASASFVGGNFVVQGAGGAVGGSYHVFSTTNLLTPLTNWVPVSTGSFNASGNVNVTNAVPPGQSQGFYLIEVP
jgi:hypothetical protein